MKEVLHNNCILVGFFRDAVMDLLVKRQGKHRNIMIVGPANCAEKFILTQLLEALLGLGSEECNFF